MHGRRWFFRPVGLGGNDGGNESECGSTDKEENSENSTRPQEEIDWHKLIWEDFLPNALTIGVPYELFWHLNPKKLKPFYTAFENKRKLRDEENWLYWGTYGLSALQTVMSHFGAGLSGKKSDVEYIKKPMYQEIANKDRELTEEEMQKEIEKAIFVEEMWIANDKRRGLPETVIK